MPNTALQVFRLGVFVLVCLLALALAGITIHTMVVAIQQLSDVIRFQIIALVAAVLTLIICPTLAFIGLCSRNSAGIWNVIELPNLFALAIIWLVAAIKIDQAMTLRDRRTGRKVPLSEFCDLFRDGRRSAVGMTKVLCTELEPMKGIAFTCFALLLLYCIITLALCIVAKARDSKRTVWKISTYNAHYFGTPPSQPTTQFQQQAYPYPNQQMLNQPQMVYAAPSVGYTYDPNTNQQVPIQMNPVGTPGQQPYVVYMQQPPPGMMMVPIPGHGQGQQLAPPPQSRTPVSTTATATNARGSVDGDSDK